MFSDLRRGLLVLASALFLIPTVASAQAPTFGFNGNLGTWTIGEVQLALPANSGNGTYTWAVTSGALPAGIALRTDVPSFFSSNAQAGLIGVATTPGTYNFTLSVTSNGQTAQQACTMKITAETLKDPYSVPNAFVGTAYSYTFTPLNTAGPVTWTVTSSLPPGINFVNGVISGTPTTPGSYNVNFNFTDGVDTVFRSFGLNVIALRFTTPGALPNGRQFNTYNTTITAAGGSGTFTYTLNGGLPFGLSMSSSGVISGTVNGGGGLYSFGITVTDTSSPANSYTQNFSIAVIGDVPSYPVISVPANFVYKTATIGFNYSRLIFASGGQAPYAWSATGLPPGMSIRTYDASSRTDMTPGEADLWGTPTQAGTFNIQITVTDTSQVGVSSTVSLPFVVSTLGIDGADFPPNGTRGAAYSTKLRVLGGTAPYSAAFFDSVNRPFPAGLTLNSTTMTLAGTPTESGFFTPVIRFTDAASVDVDMVPGFTITNPGSTITISQGFNLGTIVNGLFYSNQLSACCSSSGFYSWSLAGGALPPGLSLSSNGLLNGTPATPGTYTFLVQASDTGNPSNAGFRQFQLIVTPLNLTSTTALPFGNAGTPYSQALSVTGATGSLSFALEFGNYLPPGLSLNPATGVISGTPLSAGQFNFAIDISSNGSLLTRFFNLSIFPASSSPPLGITTNPSLGTWGVGPREFSLFAAGGTGSYSWSVAGGSLPPGLMLRPDHSTFDTTASAVLAGVLTTPGDYSFTLQLVSGSQLVTQLFTVHVSGLVLKEDFTLPDAYVGVSYSHTFTALNNAGAVTWTSSGIPAGMSLSTAGVLSGTPTTPGSYFMPLTMNDGVDTVTIPLTINLNVYAIHFTSPAVLTATQFVPFSSTMTALGGAGGFTYSSSGLPSGLSLDPNTGIISGTPANVGRFSFNLTATDSAHTSYTRTETIVTIGSPKHLVQISLGLDDCSVYVYCERIAGVSNGGTAPFAYTATGLPPGMGIRTGFGSVAPGIAGTDGELWGTPTTAGNYQITITATDAEGVTSTQTFPFHVSEMYVWGSDFLTGGTRGLPYSSTMRVIGGAGGYTVQTIPGRGFYPDGLSRSGFTVSGTPLENGFFSQEYIFSDSAGHTLTMGEGISIGDGSSTVTINNGTDLGIATVGSSFSFQLTACCIPSFTWSLTGGSLPPGLLLSPNGFISGIPTTPGTYLFLIQAADSTNPANNGARQFQLVVSPISPSVSGTLPAGNAGVFYSQTLTVTGASGSVTWSLLPLNFLPPGLSLDPSSGVLSGTPLQPGYFPFTALVTDSAGNTQRIFFNVSIYPAGVNPPLSLNFGPTFTLSPGQINFQLPASGGSPPYHFAYTPGATPVPGMNVQDGPPLPTFFPNTITAGWLGIIPSAGVYNSSLRVTDSLGAFIDRPITVTVLPPTVLSQNGPPRAIVGTAYGFTFTAAGGSGNYSFTTNTALPPGLSLATNGTLSGTPTTAGNFSFTILLNDLTASTTIGFGYTLNVSPFAINNGALLPQGTIGTSYSQTLVAPGCGSGCTFSLASGVLPSGLTLSGGGLLSGTPNSFYNSGFLVQASGSNGTTQKEFGLMINFNTVQPLFINQNSTIGPNSLYALANVFLFAQGGAPPYTWSLVSGTLPPGITLQHPGEDIGANFIPGGWYLAGKPTQIGAFTFTMKVTDSLNHTAQNTFAWSVPPILLSFTSLPLTGNPLVYNQPYSQPLLAIGGNGTYTWTALQPMPPGLALSSAGVVSGTPTNTGSFSIQLQVTDSVGHSDVQFVNFNIAGQTGTTISLPGPNLGTFSLGFTSSINLTPSGGTGPYTIAATTPLPAGCVIETGNQLPGSTGLSYVLECAPAQAGDFTFTLLVTDSLGNSGVRTETLHVAPFNLFSTSALNAGSVGRPYATTILAWDNSGSIAWSIQPGSALPAGLTLVGNTITGTPAVGSQGQYSFTLTATDASGEILNFGFSLTISTIGLTDPDILPVQAIFNTPFTYSFTAVGGGTKTFTAVGLPGGLSMSTSGVLSGVTTATGTIRITVTVTDGASTYSHPFTLFGRFADPTPLSVPIASTALSDARVGQSVSYQLSPIGGKPPYNWTLAAGSVLPPGLNLYSGTSLAANQTAGLTFIEGAPTTAGKYSFDLICTDSAGTQMRRTFTLNVTPLALLTPSLKTATVNVAYSQQITVAGGAGTYSFTYAPAGTLPNMLPPGLTASPTGLISGTPTSTGLFSFFATATDSGGHSFTVLYNLTVSNSSGLFVTTGPFTLTLGFGTNVLMSTNGPSTYSWSLVSGTPPPGLIFSTSGTSTFVSGVPTAAGTYTFTLRATDNANNANFADRTYTLNVQPFQLDLPGRPNLLPPAKAGTAYSYQLHLAGGASPYTFALSPLTPMPTGLSFDPNTATISGVPQIIGSFSFTFSVTDSGGHAGLISTPSLYITPAGQPAPLTGTFIASHDGSLGTPYAESLDQAVAGGVPPFTFAVTPGSALPPGMSIVPGANGVSSHLAGIPTVLGPYDFFLTATDSVGQTANVQSTFNVSPIATLPNRFPNGLVGTPYNVTLTSSGGTGPYTYSLLAGSGMPPGLSLTPAGVLSGTPTSPGVFGMNLTVTDNASNSLLLVYRIVIDQAGAAQGIDLTPDTLSISYVLTGPAPAATPVGVTATSGSSPFSAAVEGIPGATLSATSGNAPASLLLNLNTASLSAGTYAGVVAVKSPTAVNGLVSMPVLLTVTTPPPCTYALTPGSGSMVASGGPGSFTVSTGSLCSWTPVASDPSWIVIDSGIGPGSGTVNFHLTNNATPNTRTGSISVGGQSYGITQFGGTACSFGVSPTSVTASAAGGTATINVTASAGSCTWTASGAIASVPPSCPGGTCSGNNSATLTIPANATASTVNYSATVAGQNVSVTQSGVNCIANLTPSTLSAGSGGASGSFQVSMPAGCSYTTINGPGWMRVTANAAGSGPFPATVTYTVDPNTTTTPRQGSFGIGGAAFQISQDQAPCSFTLDTSGLPPTFAVGGGSGSIAIHTNGASCGWTASSPAPWATVLPVSGTGDGTVNLTLTSNAASVQPRPVTITVANQPVTVTQSGTACTYTLSSPNGNAPFSGGTGSVTVTAPAVCSWSSAQDATAPWLTISSSGSGGTSDVTFNAAPNPTNAIRAGTLTIAGIPYTVTQGPAPCNYTFDAFSTTVAATGTTTPGAFHFSTPTAGCSTAAQSYAGWITVSTVTDPGGKTGTVNFTAPVNPNGSSRTGVIQFGGQTFTVTQSAAACSYGLNSFGVLYSKAGTGPSPSSILASQSALGCLPVVGTDQPSIVHLLGLTGPVLNIFTQQYTVGPFNSVLTVTRRMTINFGGQLFVIKQTSW